MFCKKLLLSLSLVVIASLMIACSSGISVVKETSISEAKTLETSAAVKSEELNIKIEKVDISDIENGKTYQEIKYPIITCNDTTLQKSLDELNKKLKEGAEEFKYLNRNEIRNLIVERNDENSMYSNDTDAEVSYQGKNYLSIVTSNYVFTMGAHGGTVISGYNYDIKTGKLLKLEDFIKDKEELRKFLKDWISKQDKDMFFDWANETVDQYLDNAEYDLQCIIKDGNLSAVFQQYDIAAYAVGIIEVPIDKNLLKVEIN